MSVGEATSSGCSFVTVIALWPIHLTGVGVVGGSPGSSGRRVAMSARGLAGLLVWLRVGDQIAVAHRVVIDGELKYPIEQHPAATGTAPIETEHELVEVVSQVRVVDGALMGAQQPPLGQ
jgi:hypothetical protein